MPHRFHRRGLSVLSGSADAKRSCMAMDVVTNTWVCLGHTLVQLLDSPLDTSDLNPGYIKGYLQESEKMAANTPTRPHGGHGPRSIG